MINKLLDIVRFFALILVVLVVTEVTLRVAGVPEANEPSAQLLQSHPYYDWISRPGISDRMIWRDYNYDFRHTVQGMRGKSIVERVRPAWARKRALFLGDSVLYGLGSADDEIFAERLKKSWPDIEIINTGANGYGQRQELAIIDLLGPVVKPDVAVIIFRWNDIENNIEQLKPAFEFTEDGKVRRVDVEVNSQFDPLAAIQAKPLPKSTWKNHWESTNSHRLVGNWVRTMRDKFMTRQQRHQLRARARQLGAQLFGIKNTRVDTPEVSQDAWAVTDELLKLTQARCREIGARLIVVSIPAYAVVNEERYVRSHPEIQTDIEQPLANVTAALGIPYLDLAPELQMLDQASELPLYYLNDNHLTPEGNAVVAELLSTRLLALIDAK